MDCLIGYYFKKKRLPGTSREAYYSNSNLFLFVLSDQVYHRCPAQVLWVQFGEDLDAGRRFFQTQLELLQAFLALAHLDQNGKGSGHFSDTQ